MSKGKTRTAARKLPASATTAVAGDADAAADPAPVRLAHQSSGGDQGRPPVELDDEIGVWNDHEYLIRGTGCLHGHEPGQELIEPKIGKVPSQRTTRIGIGLLIWIGVGIVFLGNLLWLSLALIGLVAWQLLSLFVQWRTGHRGHCMRTRAWRYAWGGLVPMPRVDPTREAE